MFRKLEYRQKFDDGDRAAVLELPHEVKTLKHHDYVVREGDVPEHSCVLLSGFAVRQKVVGSGHRQIVAIQMKGEVVDLQNSLPGVADHSVQMLTAGRVAMIPRKEIARIAFEGQRSGDPCGSILSWTGPSSGSGQPTSVGGTLARGSPICFANSRCGSSWLASGNKQITSCR